MPRDFDRPLYSQLLDYRGSFQPGLFGWKPPLCETQTAETAGAKCNVNDGFRSAPAAGAPQEMTAILVDEKFSAGVLCDPTHGLSGREERTGQVRPHRR